MSMNTICPSCCEKCLRSSPCGPPSSSAPSDPFRLCNYLASGTVEFKLNSYYAACDHSHAEDGWHLFSGQLYVRHLRTRTEDDEVAFMHNLDFLVKHRFVAATCRLSELCTVLFVRVYLIPTDLPGAGGSLWDRRDDVKDKAKVRMRRLLVRISQHLGSWQGSTLSESYGLPLWLLSPDDDDRNLSEIFSDLPSPTVSSQPIWMPSDKIEGMRSRLYEYQQRTVATMLQREVQPRLVPDPRYVPITGMGGTKQLFLQPGLMELVLSQPLVSEIRGGVLCEELGTGKTVMSLALILTTINQLPSAEDSVQSRGVFTPISFHSFNTADCEISRLRFYSAINGSVRGRGFPGERRTNGSTVPNVPSLVDIMLHRLRLSPPSLSMRLQGYEDQLEKTRLLEPLSLNTPFEIHYPDESDIEDAVNRRGRSRNKQVAGTPRFVWLTTATLVVVPVNLIAQWEREIHKHTEEGALRVLSLRRHTATPLAQRIASDYDIVLMTHDRVSAEASKPNDIRLLHKLPPCTCAPLPYFPSVIDCKCTGHPSVSPLLQIRWKRLIIDEGHVSSTEITNFRVLVRLLNVERRWIVTGTPTTNLLGLSFGDNTEHDIIRAQNTADADDDDTGLGQLHYPDDHISDSSSDESDDSGSKAPGRTWTIYDRRDLRKLETIMTQLLLVPMFISRTVGYGDPSRMFERYVLSLLFEPLGARLGAISVLSQVMQMFMIRHRIEDVEREVTLPALKKEVILLDLDIFGLKSYNALQAVIVVNAVDSNRIDQDYFFHTNNVDALRQVVENMIQFLFWGISDNLFNADEILANREMFMLHANERGVPEDDKKLLLQAYAHLEAVAHDPKVREIHHSEDIPFRVSNIGKDLYLAWARSASRMMLTGQNFESDLLMHADRLLKLRDAVFARPLLHEEALSDIGVTVAEEDMKFRLYRQAQEQAKKRSKKKGGLKGSGQSEKKTVSIQKAQELRQELAAIAKKRDADATGEGTATFPTGQPSSDRMRLLVGSPAAGIRVGSSTSSKLNFILEEVLQYGMTEKFLIFSASPLSLSHISEGLKLVGVKYLQFTTVVEARSREQVVLTFETSDEYRVLLMELKHGARGLNIVTASRIIFCEPVWQADVESQAIKRAHRIGQMKDITVKTLAIRSTAEEAMIDRRRMLQDHDGKLPDMLQDGGMRDFIANPRFIPYMQTAQPTLDFPLFDLPKDQDSDARQDTVVLAADSTSELNVTTDPPQKKQRVVRFFDD